MASHQLIDAYLAGLARQLPADTVDEVADGLIETWHHHLRDGLTAERAAHAAIAEFGAADRIADEFVAQAPGRRTARLLLLTGPVMGACWGTSLAATKVWTWPIPPVLGLAYPALLLATVALLAGAATSRHSYRRTRLGGLASTPSASVSTVSNWRTSRAPLTALPDTPPREDREGRTSSRTRSRCRRTPRRASPDLPSRSCSPPVTRGYPTSSRRASFNTPSTSGEIQRSGRHSAGPR